MMKNLLLVTLTRSDPVREWLEHSIGADKERKAHVSSV